MLNKYYMRLVDTYFFSILQPSASHSNTLQLYRSDGLEVEYQVPTSSQRDQEDDILVISDEDDDMPDDGVSILNFLMKY